MAVSPRHGVSDGHRSLHTGTPDSLVAARDGRRRPDRVHVVRRPMRDRVAVRLV